MADVPADVRVGVSGWRYRDWRGRFYPPGLVQRRELEYVAGLLNSVELNGSFYSLQRPASYQHWAASVPDDFLFAVKGGRYITHLKRLVGVDVALANFFASGLLALGDKLGPVLWQLPERFRRDVPRLAAALDLLPPGRHCFEFRHESWFTDDVLSILRAFGAALVYGDHPQRPWQPLELTTDWTFVRFHYGRGRRGNYSESELRELAPRVAELAEAGDTFAYYNNDWEGFAVANAKRLRRLLAAEGVRSRA